MSGRHYSIEQRHGQFQNHWMSLRYVYTSQSIENIIEGYYYQRGGVEQMGTGREIVRKFKEIAISRTSYKT